MFIAHLPAGYVLTKMVQKKTSTIKYLFIGLIGSIFPDTDLLYFFLIDNQQHLHHGYWIHIPFYWMLISITTFSIIWIFKKRNYYVPATIFFLSVFLHLILDTLVGKIEWAQPFTKHAFFLFDVPAVHDFWILNFVFHWTFAFEIILIVCAFLVMTQKRFKPLPIKNNSQ